MVVALCRVALPLMLMTESVPLHSLLMELTGAERILVRGARLAELGLVMTALAGGPRARWLPNARILAFPSPHFSGHHGALSHCCLPITDCVPQAMAAVLDGDSLLVQWALLMVATLSTSADGSGGSRSKALQGGAWSMVRSTAASAAGSDERHSGADAKAGRRLRHPRLPKK